MTAKLFGRPVKVSLVSRLGRQDVSTLDEIMRIATLAEREAIRSSDVEVELIAVVFGAAWREGKAVEIGWLDPGPGPMWR